MWVDGNCCCCCCINVNDQWHPSPRHNSLGGERDACGGCDKQWQFIGVLEGKKDDQQQMIVMDWEGVAKTDQQLLAAGQEFGIFQ